MNNSFWQPIIESFRLEWGHVMMFLPRLLGALALMALAVWAGRVLGRVVVGLLARGSFSRTHQLFFQNLSLWSAVLLGVVLALQLLGLQGMAVSLLAGGGFTAVILGFAFRGIGENFLAGFFLAFSRPFEVGDLIRSGDLEGEVKGIEMRCTHIRTDDGRDIFIPSSQIFNEPLINYTKDGLRRPSFRIGIDYGDDPEDACRAILEAVRTTPGILANPPPSVMVVSFEAQYVELMAYVWVDTFREGIDIMMVRSEVMKRAHKALRDGGFTLSSDVTSTMAVAKGSQLHVHVAGRAEEENA